MKNTIISIASGMMLLAMTGCGSASADSLGGVYSSTHKGIDYSSGGNTPTAEEYTFKYSFLPAGGCIYFDGQKERQYYNCTYEKTGDNTFEATVVYRFNDEKKYKDTIVVNGKDLQVTREGNEEAYTFTKTDETVSAETVLDSMEDTDLDKSAKDLAVNFWNNPDTVEFYPKNKNIPTFDSAIKGVKLINNSGDYYFYSCPDAEDHEDMVRAYILRCMAGGDDSNKVSVEQSSNGLTMLTVNGNMVAAVGMLTDDPDYGSCMYVIFL